MMNHWASSSDCLWPPVTVLARLKERKRASSLSNIHRLQHGNHIILSLRRNTVLFIHDQRSVVLLLSIDVLGVSSVLCLVYVPSVAFTFESDDKRREVLPLLPSQSLVSTAWHSLTKTKGGQLSKGWSHGKDIDCSWMHFKIALATVLCAIIFVFVVLHASFPTLLFVWWSPFSNAASFWYNVKPLGQILWSGCCRQTLI